MKIKDMPFFTRPGYRLKKGDSLSDAEYLAIILDRGNSRDNAIDVSNSLLKEFNFHEMKNLSFSEINFILKDEVKTMKIISILRLHEKISMLENKGFKRFIRSPLDVYNMFYSEIRSLKKEHLYALLLDSKSKVIRKVLISVGTLNNTLIHPREIFREAIKNSANSLILVHNHPSGDSTPSEDDIKITKRIKECGEMMDIKVLDHVIIGENFDSVI